MNSCLTYFAPKGAVGVEIFGNLPTAKLQLLTRQVEKNFTGVEFFAPATGADRGRVAYLFNVRLDDGAEESDYARAANGMSHFVARALGVTWQKPLRCESEEALRQKLFGGHC